MAYRLARKPAHDAATHPIARSLAGVHAPEDGGLRQRTRPHPSRISPRSLQLAIRHRPVSLVSRYSTEARKPRHRVVQRTSRPPRSGRNAPDERAASRAPTMRKNNPRDGRNRHLSPGRHDLVEAGVSPFIAKARVPRLAEGQDIVLDHGHNSLRETPFAGTGLGVPTRLPPRREQHVSLIMAM